jgi:hypothetical protein
MSVIFEKASVWNPYDVVLVERRTPRRYDNKGRLVLLDSESGSAGATGQMRGSDGPEKGDKDQLVEDTRQGRIARASDKEG